MNALRDRSWPAYTLMILAGVVFAYATGAVLAKVSSNADVIHRTAGGVLQLLGVLTVALGVSQLRRMFGLQSTLAEMVNEWGHYLREAWWMIARLFGRRRDGTVTVGSGNMTLSPATVRGHGTVGPGRNATLEDRVRLLEQQYLQISKSVFDLDGKLGEEVKRRTEALEAERQARKSAFEDLQRAMKTLATGGIRLQIVGVVWFLAGISLATWASELANLAR